MLRVESIPSHYTNNFTTKLFFNHKLFFMRTKIHLLAFLLGITFFLTSENVNAVPTGSDSFREIKTPLYDTCCGPDSLKVVSTNYPVFCVSWQVRIDSICSAPQAFEIRWRSFFSQVWKSKIVTYTSGTTINFCDSVDTCGLHVWQVRTKCNDSTYSNWVSGSKFTMPCDHDGPNSPQILSISPNPANERITINAKNVKPGPAKVSITNIIGKIVYEKMITSKIGNQLREQLSISEWQKGIYFISISMNGVVISRASLIKE